MSYSNACAEIVLEFGLGMPINSPRGSRLIFIAKDVAAAGAGTATAAVLSVAASSHAGVEGDGRAGIAAEPCP